jgi:hypothetical protein
LDGGIVPHQNLKLKTKKEINYLTIFEHGGDNELGLRGQRAYMWGTKELKGEIDRSIEDFVTKPKVWTNADGVEITSTYIIGVK